MKLPRWIWRAQLASVLVVVSCMISCGVITNICDCLPVAPDISDYRHQAKHVPLPNTPAQEITVATIFSWHQTPVLPPEAPRLGREKQLFHVANAFLQNASVNPTDCDVHLEISAVADRNAPRVVVETPVDGEYCAARSRPTRDQHLFIDRRCCRHNVRLF